MSNRDIRVLLNDILEATAKVERYTQGLSFEEFSENDMVIDAVTRNLEIIGEEDMFIYIVLDVVHTILLEITQQIIKCLN